LKQKSEKKMSTDLHNDLCQTCGVGGDVLCCDFCNLVFHMKCLNPPLTEEPEGEWGCPVCTEDASKRYAEKLSVQKQKQPMKKLALACGEQKASPTDKKHSSSSYLELVELAVVVLKEKGGSSSKAISKFVSARKKTFNSTAFGKALKTLVERDILIKVKFSYKLAAAATPRPGPKKTKYAPTSPTGDVFKTDSMTSMASLSNKGMDQQKVAPSRQVRVPQKKAEEAKKVFWVQEASQCYPVHSSWPFC
jgi:hypothetical protein